MNGDEYILTDDAGYHLRRVRDIFGAIRFLRSNGFASQMDDLLLVAHQDTREAATLLADLGFKLVDADFSTDM